MAVRRWQVHPDMQVPTSEGLVAAVSREAQVEAAMDIVSLLDRAGGVATIVVGRHPTDLPGEMLTTGMVLEWKDRTDARTQPEQQVDVVTRQEPYPESPAAAPANGREVSEALADGAQIRVESATNVPPEALAEARAAHSDDIGDGLDPSTLEDEDLASVPELLR